MRRVWWERAAARACGQCGGGARPLGHAAGVAGAHKCQRRAVARSLTMGQVLPFAKLQLELGAESSFRLPAACKRVADADDRRPGLNLPSQKLPLAVTAVAAAAAAWQGHNKSDQYITR
eukprot:364313-Chlamydomonas_euryale.AAC.6